MSEYNGGNLTPFSKDEPERAAACGRRGAEVTNAKRREKKLMSEIYAEFLSEEHDVKIDDLQKKLSGQRLAVAAMARVLARGDSASVAMLKEIRETLDRQANGNTENAQEQFKEILRGLLGS